VDRVLRNGGPRRRPRARATIVTNIYSIRPFLTEVASRHATLRQVTRDDVITWLADRPSRTDASALRDLFDVLKTQRLIFANPMRRIRAVRNNQTIPTPLPHVGSAG
jgi:site-specific recombinase XerD